MFKPVERASLVEEVAGQIRLQVLDGRLKPDDKLPSQQELCAQLGVSRTCVREAVRLLEGYGLLETRPGGTYVRPHTQASRGLLQAWRLTHEYSIEEYLQTRIALEGATAALAARRGSLPAVAAIERAFQAMRQAATLSDWDGLVASELAFHRAIYEASGNALLADLVGHLNDWLAEVGQAVLSLPERADRVVALHQPVIEAILRRDPDGARQAMAQAIHDFAEEFGISLD